MAAYRFKVENGHIIFPAQLPGLYRTSLIVRFRNVDFIAAIETIYRMRALCQFRAYVHNAPNSAIRWDTEESGKRRSSSRLGLPSDFLCAILPG